MSKTEIITPPKGWKVCPWPFDPEHAKTVTCYSYKIARGTIYLQDAEFYPFTVSCGPNSDRSFSGCFYGRDDVTSIYKAMVKIEERNRAGEFA
jgi:hypothetical protein